SPSNPRALPCSRCLPASHAWGTRWLRSWSNARTSPGPWLPLASAWLVRAVELLAGCAWLPCAAVGLIDTIRAMQQLADTSIAELLADAYKARRTGSLILESDTGQLSAIRFADG